MSHGGGDRFNNGRWIWLSKEREWLREDHVLTFLECCISECISLDGEDHVLMFLECCISKCISLDGRCEGYL